MNGTECEASHEEPQQEDRRRYGLQPEKTNERDGIKVKITENTGIKHEPAQDAGERLQFSKNRRRSKLNHTVHA